MLLLWVLIVSSLTGCDNRAEALELAKDGKTSAETMAKFYDSLIRDTRDTWELEVYLLNFSRTAKETDVIELTPKQKNLFQTRINEIQKRANLARNLAATYGALETFASYDAPAAVQGSVTNLASSITGLGIIPLPTSDGKEVDPSKIFGMIAQDIAAWKQSKDLREGSDLILKTIQKLEYLFYLEKDAYKYIPAEKGRKILRGITNCIDKQNCAFTPMKKYLEQMDFESEDVDKAAKDIPTKFAILGMVTARNDEKTELYMSAADGIKDALHELVLNHQKFRNNEGLSLSGIKQGFERAQAYLDAIQEARKGNKTE